MWDTLEVTHEGTNDVKRARKHTLIQEYEMFIMLKGESIADVQKWFTHIVNFIMSLGKVFDKYKLKLLFMLFLLYFLYSFLILFLSLSSFYL